MMSCLCSSEKGEISECDSLTNQIIGGAIEVHRVLGPGLLESAYEACLLFELRSRGLKVETQKILPVFYKDIIVDCAYRLDLVSGHGGVTLSGCDLEAHRLQNYPH